MPKNHSTSGLARAGLVAIAASVAQGQTPVLPRLHRAICDGGGWVLHRIHARSGLARVVFEFPRDICLDLYGSMVSLGLELSAASHLVMADLCRCTPYLCDLSSRSIAVKDNASLDRATAYICSLEFVKVELSLSFAAPPEFGEGDSAEKAA